MLDQAVKNGQWLIFNNCHLLEHWDEKIVRHLYQLISYFSKCPNKNTPFISSELLFVPYSFHTLLLHITKKSL